MILILFISVVFSMVWIMAGMLKNDADTNAVWLILWIVIFALLCVNGCEHWRHI
jgi:hypothetical protein